jgi:hypothetical protein
VARAASLMESLPLPPAPMMGLSVRTEETRGGACRTTVALVRPLLFRAAARVALARVGRRLFPAVADRWNAGPRIRARTDALARYLADEDSRLRQAFP